ncbi:MAG: phage-related protein [Bacillariaceae sp.]|jgi:phage-related protein
MTDMDFVFVERVVLEVEKTEKRKKKRIMRKLNIMQLYIVFHVFQKMKVLRTRCQTDSSDQEGQ